jgi:hypothetical protein
MSGNELRKMAEAAGLTPIEVLHEAGINSPETLRKVYNDVPVRATTRVKVEKAIKRLSAKQAVAG